MTKIMREKLERILERRGLSQAELERLAGLAENRIAKLKAAKRSGPSAAEALRVARVLRVPMEWLCDDAATHDPDHIKPMLAEWEAYVIDAIRSAGLDYRDVMKRLMLAPWTQTIPDPDHPGLQEIRDKVAGRNQLPGPKKHNNAG